MLALLGFAPAFHPSLLSLSHRYRILDGNLDTSPLVNLGSSSYATGSSISFLLLRRALVHSTLRFLYDSKFEDLVGLEKV